MRILGIIQLGIVLLAVGCDKTDRADSGKKSFNWFGDLSKSPSKTGERPSLKGLFQPAAKSQKTDKTPVAVTESETGSKKQKTQEKPKPGSYLHLKTVKIYDRQGFGEPIVSRVFLAPAKWKTEGGVFWNIRAVREESIQERFRVTHPDGRARFEKFGQYNWHWSTSPYGRQLLMQMRKRLGSLLTAKQALEQVYLPRYRGNVKVAVKSITPLPKVAEEFTKRLAADYARYPQLKHHKISCEMAVAKLEYRIGDQAYEECVTLQLLAVRRPTVGPEAARFSDGRTHGFVYSCFLDMFAFRAPAGELEGYKPLITTMLGTMRQNPAWNRAIQQHMAEMSRIDLDGLRKRGEIRRKANAEIAEMRRVGWQKQQRSRDRNTRAFNRMIREVEPYRDPQTGEEIELNFGYDFAYRNERGEYLITNNTLFDPNVELEGTWRKLKKLKD